MPFSIHDYLCSVSDHSIILSGQCKGFSVLYLISVLVSGIFRSLVIFVVITVFDRRIACFLTENRMVVIAKILIKLKW